MRTINFRGKTHGNGKWYYGSLVYSNEINAAIYFQIGRGLVKRMDWVYVNPETVGQFTGLYDCDGKEIFEGDILRIYDFANVVCEFRHGAFGYIYCDEFHPFAGNTNYTFNPKNTDKEFEVIGNIYDNPDLLKGGKI